MYAYIVTYGAQKHAPIGLQVHRGACMVVANNLHEALGIAQEKTKEFFPPSAGYHNHVSDAAPITVDKPLLEAITNNYNLQKEEK